MGACKVGCVNGDGWKLGRVTPHDLPHERIGGARPTVPGMRTKGKAGRVGHGMQMERGAKPGQRELTGSPVPLTCARNLPPRDGMY